MAQIVFVLLGLVCVGCVIVPLASADRTRGVLSLVLAFAALGGIYGLLGAPFVAAIQVLITAGAIMVLFLFVIMTVDGERPDRRPGLKRIILPASILTAVFLLEIVLSLRGTGGRAGALAVPNNETQALGTLLVGRYIFAFEIASLLILAALVGAVALAAKKGRG